MNLQLLALGASSMHAAGRLAACHVAANGEFASLRLLSTCQYVIMEVNKPTMSHGCADDPNSPCALQVARFVRFCDAFEIPLIVLVDPSHCGTQQAGRQDLRGVAQLLFAFAEASVPKLALLLSPLQPGSLLSPQVHRPCCIFGSPTPSELAAAEHDAWRGCSPVTIRLFQGLCCQGCAVWPSVSHALTNADSDDLLLQSMKLDVTLAWPSAMPHPGTVKVAEPLSRSTSGGSPLAQLRVARPLAASRHAHLQACLCVLLLVAEHFKVCIAVHGVLWLSISTADPAAVMTERLRGICALHKDV